MDLNATVVPVSLAELIFPPDHNCNIQICLSRGLSVVVCSMLGAI